VFGTLHTTDAPQTVDRIIDVFEPDAQQQVRMQLSTCLQAVISQTLLPRADGIGRVAAFEVMVATPAIRTLIREGKTYQMYTDIQTGSLFGMQTLDSHLLKLVQQGLILYDDALAKTSNPSEFEMRYKRSQDRSAAPEGEGH
jgi:twitching motility protein PilT